MLHLRFRFNATSPLRFFTGFCTARKIRTSLAFFTLFRTYILKSLDVSLELFSFQLSRFLKNSF